MPTDPPTANPTAQPVPPGQAQPIPPQLTPRQQVQSSRRPSHHSYPHQPLHPHYPRPPNQNPYGQPIPPLRSMPSMQPSQQMPQPTVPQQHSIRRDTVPHQQQPPYYPVNSYTPIGSFPQRVTMDQYSVNGYMFPQTPYTYNPLPNPAPQQPAPVGPRGNRNFPQPMAPEMRSKPRVTVPTQQKRIIPIFDPDTKQEIKVSVNEGSNTSSSTNVKSSVVKIPHRTSRPLELVADPADVAKSDDSKPSTNKPAAQDLSTKPAAQPKDEVVIPESNTSSISSDVNEKSSTSQHNKELSNGEQVVTVSKPHAIEEKSSPVVAEINQNREGSISMKSEEQSRTIEAITSDISSSTVTDLHGDADETPQEPHTQHNVDGETEKQSTKITETSEQARSETPQAVQVAVNVQHPSEQINASNTIQNLTSASNTAITPTNTDKKTNGDHKSSSEVKSQRNSAALEDTHEQESDDAEMDAKKDVNKSAVLRRVRPIFKEGERRVYGFQFINEMKAFFDKSKAEKIEEILHSVQIHKDDSGEQKNDRSGSRPARSMSGDSRGNRGFPGQSATGFQMGAQRVSTGVVGGGMGRHDAFDLRSARSQNPPPVTRTHSGRDGDPRGSRNQSGSRRFDGPGRGGHGPIEAISSPPIEKLPKSENAWKRNKEADDEVTSKVKQVRSLLNKLTLEKFEKIFKQIIDIDLTSYDIVIGIVKEIFEKTLFEPKFSEMYAELCSRLEKTLTPLLQQSGITDQQDKPINFKRILLNNCRDEFNAFRNPNAEEDDTKSEKGDDETKEQEKSSDTDEKSKDQKEELSEEDKQLNAFKAKRRMLANVRFIGELFLKDLIPERTIHRYCIQPLITQGVTSREEDVLEALCKLLSKTGAKLSTNQEAITHIDNYFKRLIALQLDATLPARIRFMIQDLVEQRQDNWKLRREEAKAKTIAEIHKDIEKEERAKVEAQAAARERKNRGGNMHSRDRGPHSTAPRMQMTMASRQRTTSTVSRSTAMLEKHAASRGASGISSNLQSKRLGPSGAKLGSGGAGGVGATSLRPSSRLNQFAALADNRESVGNIQSGDVRRSKLGMMQSNPRRSTARAESQEPKIKTLEPEKVKTKARGIIEEYWSISMISEVHECVKEIPEPNHAAFVEECFRVALDSRKENREKSAPFFVALTDCGISQNDFITAFRSIISDLEDMTVDNPVAAEFVSIYIGAIIGTGKLGTHEDNGLNLTFLRPLVEDMMNKRLATKLMLGLFSETYKQFAEKIPDIKERREFIRKNWDAVDVDVAAYMINYNPMRGLDSLKDMIKERQLDFLFPLLDPELEFKQLIEQDGNSETVKRFLTSHNELILRNNSEKMVRMLVREALVWLFGQSLDTFKDNFKSILCVPLLSCFSDGVPKGVQLGAILEAQAFIVMNSNTLPDLGTGSDAYSPGSLVFSALYDGDLVEEESFMQWKEDTNKSMSTPGKQEMIIQTSKFFAWLENAEVGE